MKAEPQALGTVQFPVASSDASSVVHSTPLLPFQFAS